MTRSPMKNANDRSLVLLACVAVLVAACDESAKVETETHFLRACDDTCDDGYSCICGVCTEACASDAECTRIEATATCAETSASCGSDIPRTCEVECTTADDCDALGEGYGCMAGRCRAAPAAAGGGTSGATGGAPDRGGVGADAGELPGADGMPGAGGTSGAGGAPGDAGVDTGAGAGDGGSACDGGDPSCMPDGGAPCSQAGDMCCDPFPGDGSNYCINGLLCDGANVCVSPSSMDELSCDARCQVDIGCGGEHSSVNECVIACINRPELNTDVCKGAYRVLNECMAQLDCEDYLCHLGADCPQPNPCTQMANIVDACAS